MDLGISKEERQRIASGIRERYARVAASPEGQFAYPTGRIGLDLLHYDQTLTARLSDEVAAYYCGVGNPFALGPIHPGERVLDVGCGAGVDTILAGMMTGPRGVAVGVDIVPEMIARAEKNLEAMDLGNVTFRNASGESLPFADRSFDLAISNGAINLIPDKAAALSEIARVLIPGGRLLLADQIAVGNVAKDIESRLANWFQWEGGTLPGKDFLALLERAGFHKVELAGETGFNSTPKTKGVLVRAAKPAARPSGGV